MSLNIPNGFNTVDEHLDDLATRMQASHPYNNSRSASGNLTAVEEVHDKADQDKAVQDKAVHEEGVIIYERDLRYNNKRDIDFTKVPIGTKVHVFASRHSGEYSYTVESSYEATLANKKIAQHKALILMRDRCKELQPKKEDLAAKKKEDLADKKEEELTLRTEISALRRMQSRTKKINILEALAEGHTRALEIYKDQQTLDNARVELSNERLAKVYQFNTMLLDVDNDVIKNARYNVLKPSAGKKKKRSAHQDN